jgi:hypothetical protein
MEMQNLKSAKGKADELLVKKDVIEDDYEVVITTLKNSIVALEKKLNVIKSDPRYQNETLENIGLLGSAFKRLAELYFFKRLLKKVGTDTDERNALAQSLEYYKLASERNLSHHWSLVQYISLDIVLNKQLSDEDYWYTARKATKQAIAKNKDDVWAYGSLLELLFLDPTVSNQNEALIEKALVDLLDACNKALEGTYSLETTYTQLNRYKTWWTIDNGYEMINVYLMNNGAVLDSVLSGLQTAISGYGK